MIKILETAIAKVESLPEDRQAYAAHLLEQTANDAIKANGAKPRTWFWALVHTWWLRRSWHAHKPYAFADTRTAGLVNIEPVEGHLDLWKAVGENRFFTGDQINCISDMMGLTGIPSSRSK